MFGKGFQQQGHGLEERRTDFDPVKGETDWALIARRWRFSQETLGVWLRRAAKIFVFDQQTISICQRQLGIYPPIVAEFYWDWHLSTKRLGYQPTTDGMSRNTTGGTDRERGSCLVIKRNKEFTVKKSSQDTLVALVPLVGSSWGFPTPPNILEVIKL